VGHVRIHGKERPGKQLSVKSLHSFSILLLLCLPVCSFALLIISFVKWKLTSLINLFFILFSIIFNEPIQLFYQNKLELEFLVAIDWNVYVSVEDFQVSPLNFLNWLTVGRDKLVCIVRRAFFVVV
jgi:hypothetical protein